MDANSKIEHATSDVRIRFGEPSTVFRWLRVKCPGVDTVRAEVSHSTGDGVSNTNFDDTLQQRRRAILLDQYDGKDVVLATAPGKRCFSLRHGGVDILPPVIT